MTTSTTGLRTAARIRSQLQARPEPVRARGAQPRARRPAADPRSGGRARRGRGQGGRRPQLPATRRPTPNTPRRARRSAKSSRSSNAKPWPRTRSNGGRSSTPRSTGEAKAKAEFAAASRKIATMFDAAAIRSRANTPPARPRPPQTYDSEPEEGRQAERREEQADRRQRRAGRLASGIDWPSWPPSTRNSGSIPSPRRPSPNRTRSSTIPAMSSSPGWPGWISPCRLLEGLIIPKSMKGGREAWVFILLISLFAGLGMLIRRRSRPAWASAPCWAACSPSCSAPGSSSSPRSQLERLYTPLTQSLADADALTAYCRGQVDAEFKEERKRIAARRDEDLKTRRGRPTARRSPPPRARRDEKLRKINEVYAERMVEVQTTQQARPARRHRRPRPPHGRASRPGPRPASPSSTRSTRRYKERIRTDYETAWSALADRWREGMKPGGGRARRGQPRGRRLLPRLERPRLGRSRPLPRLVPPVIRFGDGPARPRRAAAAASRPTPT